MAKATNDNLARAVTGTRFIALSQLGIAVGDVRHWDRDLVREPRLLVPIDVQVLVVREGDEPMVRLPFRTADDKMLPVDDPGEARPPGAHLLWTVPSTFGRGKVVDDPAAPGDPGRRRLDLPVLPDRWVVLRLAVPVNARDAHVRGWVLEADTATVTPLADWPTTRTNTATVGPPLQPEQINLHVGGPSWASCYDAAQGRFSLHDPLEDLASAAPEGVEGDALSYVVAGWWSDERHDPLNGVGSLIGYHARLAQLGWDDPDHPRAAGKVDAKQYSAKRAASAFGMKKAARYERSSAGTFAYRGSTSAFVGDAVLVADIADSPTRTTMLTGRIHGVPLSSDGRPDDRPAPSQVRLAYGPTTPSVAAVLASGAVSGGGGGASAQRNAERLLTAFSSGLLGRIEQPDSWPDIEQYEHAQGFSSLPGGTETVDRFVDKPRAGTDPGSGARRGRRTSYQVQPLVVAENILWSSKKATLVTGASFRTKAAGGPPVSATAPLVTESVAAAQRVTVAPTIREVARPAGPFVVPTSPVLAVVGAGRRLLAAERDESDGLLRVRTSDQPVRGLAGMLTADELLRTLGSGAVPDEVLTVAREALAEDPFVTRWRTRRIVGKGMEEDVAGRVRAEAAVNYAYYAGADDRLSGYVGVNVASASMRQAAVEGLLKHSFVEGVFAHPEGVTMWGQPWRPLFCEWSVELDLADAPDLAGWALEEIDLERSEPFGSGGVVTLSGRSPLVTGTATSLAAAVERWMKDEQLRNDRGVGLASDAVEAAMAGLRTHLSGIDVLSLTLDGIRETLLGLHYERGVVRHTADAGPDGVARGLAVDLPRLVAAGRVRLTSGRVVDAYGRVLELPVETAVVAARSSDTQPGPVLHLRPRINAAARVRLRLVDPLALSGTAATARVDQAEAAAQVNPVAGFLLPDHIDEALEMFAVDGTPLGQVSHDPFSDAVAWEGAPGRTDIGPAAGPLDDLVPGHRRLGWIAAALTAVDASERQGRPGRPETESALSALLRAIDTTLWTVDPFGSLGREHIAGLVGRPIAVVTAHLTLDVSPDLDELVYGDGTSREARERAFAELASVPFSIRLGSAARSDDGLLGYFVDDDYQRFFAIDRVIMDEARETGRCRGDLGVGGTAGVNPIVHPYVLPGGDLTIRAGQTVRLTLLMHPGGKVHVTSGITPRTSVALARDWVQPGLSVMAPSVRVGPLLIDADQVRLPKVASFPAAQLFTRRDSPGSWRDDPILAATQAAYLPDEASAIEEGWIRIAPEEPAATPPAAGG